MRGVKQARAAILEAIKHDLTNRFAAYASPDTMYLAMAYTYDLEAALAFKKEAEEAFPGYDIHMDPLSLSVSCHIGPGALAMTCTRRMDIL